jgi:hypothetical protein
MKTRTRRRLARLEARWINSTANENDLMWYEFKSTVMSIVAVYAGQLKPEASLATALARALDMTAGELKNALSSNNRDDPDIWPRVLEKLNAIVAAHGGRPVTENGSLILERSPQDDGRRNGLEVFDELYERLPEGMKERHHLLPCLADYLL